jgi:hypothetical protein
VKRRHVAGCALTCVCIMQGGSLSVREGEDILLSAVDAQLRTEVASESSQQVVRDTPYVLSTPRNVVIWPCLYAWTPRSSLPS